ncbi:ribonuclease activity regulator RraA [Arthrobacter sp. I2-34]|uniref:Putative 4-hydroxy-4-methyl-2-oxoglutarate aldolase n=1 Tax=Arthrobacter hankyongi TaxID=2904801 RepID=A0ABS9L408_9MICC|nr:ribonuclease activity regulator RraA [Arthrobacter hankyongi]MCG2621398.1 ribonuclease activity regulator RraA [Arthrobacter hankyongi]
MSAAITEPLAATGLDPAVREKLLKVGSANVANVLLKRGFRNVMMLGVAPLSADQPQLVGPAYTLRFIPAREDLDSMANYGRGDNKHRRAIEECPAGSVLVIDAGGSLAASSMGDMMAARLKYRGVSGVVTDGGYRDAAAIRGTGLPCYQVRNAPPATPIALHPVALDEPVGCAGVAVYPGDVIVGDSDGVVVIPWHLATEVADEALDAVEYEEFAARHIANGRSIFGLFPATPQSRAEYDEWVAAGRPEVES